MRKLLPHLAILFLLLMALLGRAQEIQISGRVVDAATKDPIPFSSVRLCEAKELVTSDEMGYFQIANTFGKGLDTLTVTVFVSLHELLSVQVKVMGKDPVVVNVTGGGLTDVDGEPFKFQL